MPPHSRTILHNGARRALTALLALVCFLTPMAPLAARQVADATRAGTCGMPCCQRSGHCCCRKPKPAAQAPALAAPGCPAGCAAAVQPVLSGPGLFKPAESASPSSMAAAAALPIRGTVILASTWQLPSLWQRPPPSFLF